jgi:hypothetical protein
LEADAPIWGGLLHGHEPQGDDLAELKVCFGPALAWPLPIAPLRPNLAGCREKRAMRRRLAHRGRNLLMMDGSPLSEVDPRRKDRMEGWGDRVRAPLQVGCQDPGARIASRHLNEHGAVARARREGAADVQGPLLRPLSQPLTAAPGYPNPELPSQVLIQSNRSGFLVSRLVFFEYPDRLFKVSNKLNIIFV